MMACWNRCLAVQITLFFTFLVGNSATISSNNRGRFQRQFQVFYHQWFEGFQQTDTESQVECSLRCVRVVYCMGFHYDGKTCTLFTYSWLPNTPHSLTSLDSSKFYIFNEQGTDDYIFDRIRGLSFRLYMNPMTWQDALEHCQKGNATLVNIKSVAKNNFVHKIRNGIAIHIGASDIQTEGDWRWTDGTPLIYDDFYSGQPNNYDGNYPTKEADCCVMGPHWSDNYCGHLDQFICERAE